MPKVNDTAFKTSCILGTAEAESEENSAKAAAPIEQARDPNDAGAPLKIMGEQTIRTADEMHKAFAEYLDRGIAVVVDLSEVDECDAAALQLIYALRQSAIQRGQRFRIAALSPAITDTAAALGLHIETLMTGYEPAAADGDCEVAEIDNGI
ncbi:STAS domain-containing protein [uncultured Paludibaculum sp.]|uniref:STAS domain-containing protein n=1 Tax=uncultured Paludibaculum sp. TaxID=1765020 RepID=UPI002AAA9FBA|nr:STAS domain-containing protein [uncultured Paludibaculum sp.]